MSKNKNTSNTTSLKQGNLFSFFTKKPKDVKTASISSATNAAVQKATAVVNTTNITNKIDPSSSPTKPQLQQQQQHQQVLQDGTKIEVFWPDDDEYYGATVQRSLVNEQNITKYIVQYEDQTKETLDLTKETWRLLVVVNNKKRIVVKHQDTDDEYEYNDDDDEEEEEEEERSEEIDCFLVDSEEDDDHQPRNNNKKRSLTKHVTDSVKRRLVKVSAHKKHKTMDTTTTFSQNDAKKKEHKNTKNKTMHTSTSSQNEGKKEGSNKQCASNFLSPVFQRFKATTTTLTAATTTTETQKIAKPLVTPPPYTLPNNTNLTTSATTSTSATPVTGMFRDGEVNPVGTHLHNHLEFLYPPKLRDGKGHASTSPQYDPRTLQFGPAEEADICKLLSGAKSALTPASKQWWEIKSKYFDTILFFKTGLFYEIYNMDADVACRELGFVYMKGAIAHSGFPESAYGYMSGRLIDKGYKVARVEQTETPEQLADRKKKTCGTKKPQVVNREVCSIVSSGTRTYCFLDDTKCFNGGNECSISHGPLLSIKEISLAPQEGDDDADNAAICEYGITIVDAVRSIITVGQFADDILRSRMLTLLTTFTPSEIILEQGACSKELIQLVQMTQTARIEKMLSQEEFPQSNAILEKHRTVLNRPSPCHPWDAHETVEELARKRYWSSTPDVLDACIQGGANLALSSMGAALFYLQRALVDEEIFTFGCVKAYVPPGSPVVSSDDQNTTRREEKNTTTIVSEPSTSSNSDLGIRTLHELFAIAAAEEDGFVDSSHVSSAAAAALSSATEQRSSHQHVTCASSTDHMQVDGSTIENLELLFNQSDKTSRNSLWAKLNYTKTPHGFRLLRAWLLRPLFRKADIERRQNAVAELCVGSAAFAMSEARPMLQRVGDLERLLSRVHAMGGSTSAEAAANPNERAMLYDGAIYTQRKIKDFHKLIEGLHCAAKVIDLLSPEKCGTIENGLLRKIVRRQKDGGCFPDNLEEELSWFTENSECFDEEYDAACAEVERIEQELENYKIEMCRNLGRNAISQWTYINTKPGSRDKYLIELPVSIPVPQDFYIKAKRGTGTKQVNKYRTEVVEKLVNALEAALEEKKAGKERSTQLLFQKFDSLRTIWTAAAHATAMLDALGSLAHVSSMPGMVRPTILDENGSPTLHYRHGRHFCVDLTHDGGGFIPNDLTLGRGDSSLDGTSSPRVLLLSGPNMGGKSTMLRQTCLIAIMAQIGCFVPAQECSLTPVDRIFTRLGASDRILSGQSTFFVELAETAAALRGATRRSLVIMDELGRGTSTFDGTAIASATVQHLVETSGCLVMFATHYHSLLEDWRETPSVRLGHMECLVEKEEQSNNITFLYTLGEGVCPKSFGINVARLAGLPEEVLKIAEQKSNAFEDELSSGITSSEEDKIIKEMTAAVEAGDIVMAERLWDTLQAQ